MELEYEKIIERIKQIDPKEYKDTRNFLDGAVTRLSPYITRGLITLPQVRDLVLENHSVADSYKFIQELAWREYFQKVWLAKDDKIFSDIRFSQKDAESGDVPEAIVNAETGINALDQTITELYETGYMHNHARMTVASVICNLGKYRWWEPSRWMYYHLLDGDLASNSLSWQWVAGTSISKAYTTCQSLINYWSKSDQTDTWLDFPREHFDRQPIPDALEESIELSLEAWLPKGDDVDVKKEATIFLYHPWHLDPKWKVDEEGAENAARILIFEPSHFKKYPVSEKVIDFIVALARENISNIQVFVGEIADLEINDVFQKAYTVEHPTISHFADYSVEMDERAWLFPAVTGYYKSFFAFWKECEKCMNQN